MYEVEFSSLNSSLSSLFADRNVDISFLQTYEMRVTMLGPLNLRQLQNEQLSGCCTSEQTFVHLCFDSSITNIQGMMKSTPVTSKDTEGLGLLQS